MTIRNAIPTDSSRIHDLLKDIAIIHYNGRPDLFTGTSPKYTTTQFLEFLLDSNTPTFVAVDDDNFILGYAFCKFISYPTTSLKSGYKSLFIDDICVDESKRGSGVGKAIFEYLKSFAAKNKCSNIELNVWEFNSCAIKFYELNGMVTQRRQMELSVK